MSHLIYAVAGRAWFLRATNTMASGRRKPAGLAFNSRLTPAARP